MSGGSQSNGGRPGALGIRWVMCSCAVWLDCKGGLVLLPCVLNQQGLSGVEWLSLAQYVLYG